MPVRPENLARYPKDWPLIAHAVKERAGWRCQGSPAFPDCRVRHKSIGWRDEGGAWHQVATEADRQALADTQYRYGDTVKLIRIVLTVGHFDHQPENCASDNLFAWCQRCHLYHDRHHHAETAYMTRRAARGVDDLFHGGTDARQRPTDL